MGFFSRENAGGDFMAVPPVPQGDMLDEEVLMLEKRRKEIEVLETKIVEVEGNFNHPEYEELPKLREELSKLTSQ